VKNWEDKMMYAIYALFGGAIGILLFAVPLGGWDYIFLGESKGFWDGPVSMILWTTFGAGWGLLSYRYHHYEVDPETAAWLRFLISRRGRMLIFGIVALYFVYDVAKGL